MKKFVLQAIYAFAHWLDEEMPLERARRKAYEAVRASQKVSF